MKQIYAAHVSAQSAFTLPDLAAALKQIQTQYDDIAAKNLQVQKYHTKPLPDDEKYTVESSVTLSFSTVRKWIHGIKANLKI